MITAKQQTKEQLATADRNLNNFVQDENIRAKQRALDNELERETRQNQTEREGIQAALAETERAHQARIEMITSERIAHEGTIELQIAAITQQREMYAAQAEERRTQISEIQDSIARSGDLVRKVMERIDNDGANLYRQLIEWNERYGTGIYVDISNAWARYLDLVDAGNATTLDRTMQIMHEIERTTRSIAAGQMFIAQMSGAVGAYAAPRAAAAPQSADLSAAYSAALANIGQNNISALMQNAQAFNSHFTQPTSTQNTHSSTVIHNYNTNNMEFNGVTSESILTDIPRAMGTVAKSVANHAVAEYHRRYENATQARGISSSIRTNGR